jgi:undecaprenyl phosphate N,N'-diacetylbacillosamine 1-phosphate transferase
MAVLIITSICFLILISVLLYKSFFKRLYDILLSGMMLLLLSPLMLVLTIFGAIVMKGNPFFTQQRPGKNEKLFRLIKYRSMTNEKDSHGNLLPDKRRLTKYGRILRSFSLDELPELINIFLGDMSFVGPRPLLPIYLSYYTKEEKHRHDVRPGLTGLAQINGRSFISWEEIFHFDLEYVKNVSLVNDVVILLKTIIKVFLRNDIADLSNADKDAEGRYHCIVDGKEYIVHQPLNIEREKQ